MTAVTGNRFGRWGRDGEAYAAYTGTARRLVAADDRVRAARDAWTAFLLAGHGDVFAGLSGEDPATDLFVDAMYYDYVVGRLLSATERATGVAVANPGPADGGPGAGAAAGLVDPGAVHDRVVAAGADVPGPAAAGDDAPVDAAAAGWFAAAARGNGGGDLLARLYESVVAREVRRALGQYDTPRGVAALAVDALDVPDPAAATVLDPGCGSGVFLAVWVDRVVAAMDGADPAEVVAAATGAVRGVDVNPVAVRAAKLRYLLALAPALEAAAIDRVHLPVALADALALAGDATAVEGGDAAPGVEWGTTAGADDPPAVEGPPAYGADHAPDGDPTVDYLVGNPPWLPWGRLPAAARERWRDRYVDALDLLPHEGAAARLGHANDDVSVPYVWVCVDRYLREGGRAAFVLKRGATKGPAGTLLRRLRVGDRPLALTRVHAFDGPRPFGDEVDAAAAVYAFAADEEGEFPVPTTVWRGDAGDPDFSTGAALRASLSAERTGLVPVDPDDPASAWVREDAERAALGTCAHDVRHGVKDDAAAVYGLDREQLAAVEPDLVYPYLKSRHVRRYGVDGHDLRLVPMRTAGEDNEDWLREACPGTYAYLRDHRDRLEGRSSSWLDDGPFYAVFGLGEYTWADYKVVWCRLGFKPEFAVVSTVTDPDLGEKPVVPGDHYMFVATDDEREAHLLCALLNSAPYRRSLRAVGGAGKASLTKAVVSELRLPEWPGRGTGGASGRAAAPSIGGETAERLAALSMDAHEVVAGGGDGVDGESGSGDGELGALQAEIDGLVEDLLASRSGSR